MGCVGYESLIGSYLLCHHLNGTVYCAFLREVVPVLHEGVPLVVRHDVWFQHDGAPAQFGAQSQQLLNTVSW